MLFVLVTSYFVVNKQISILKNIALLDEKSDEVIYRTQKILTIANSIKFGINDFLFAKNKNSLQLIQESKRNINEEITILNRLRKDNQIFKTRIDSISYYVEKHIKFLNLVYFSQNKKNINSKYRLAFLLENKLNSDELHKQIDLIHLDENKFMMQQNKDHQKASLRLASLLILLILLITLLILTLVLKVRSEIAASLLAIVPEKSHFFNKVIASAISG